MRKVRSSRDNHSNNSLLVYELDEEIYQAVFEGNIEPISEFQPTCEMSDWEKGARNVIKHINSTSK